MKTMCNDWELSEEDMRVLLYASHTTYRALRHGVVIVATALHLAPRDWDEVDMTNLDEHDDVPRELAELIEQRDEQRIMAESLRQHRAKARGEHAILEELRHIEHPPSRDEDLRVLDCQNLPEWEHLLTYRRGQLERLRALSLPQLILDNQQTLVLAAEAGVAWQRYRIAKESSKEGL